MITTLEKKDKLISNTRLFSQKIAGTEFNTAKEIVSWMGAMQAQDYAMSKWAIGIRLLKPAIQKIEASIDKGEILRIHILRPTWHFVSADDIHWMLALSAPKILSSMKSRHKAMELSEATLRQTNSLIEKALAKNKSLTRDELVEEIHKAKIKTDNNRLSHILFCAELEGIMCSGPSKENKQTYALISERAPKKKNLNRDESLAELTKRYFTSHCPATIQDFAWWSNLNLTEIRKAVDSMRSEFDMETIGSQQYLFPHSFKHSDEKPSLYLLPAYDEYLISYKDRSSSLSLIHNKRAVSDNGIFYPPVIVNGQVAGLWKRRSQKDKIIVETDFFNKPAKSIRTQISAKSEEFGHFLGKDTEVMYKSEVMEPETSDK
jgi:hypothetical protein